METCILRNFGYFFQDTLAGFWILQKMVSSFAEIGALLGNLSLQRETLISEGVHEVPQSFYSKVVHAILFNVESDGSQIVDIGIDNLLFNFLF